MTTFHVVRVWVDDSGIEVECDGLELTVDERRAFIKFWLDGVA